MSGFALSDSLILNVSNQFWTCLNVALGTLLLAHCLTRSARIACSQSDSVNAAKTLLQMAKIIPPRVLIIAGKHYQSLSVHYPPKFTPGVLLFHVFPICSYTPIVQALYFHSWSVTASHSQIAWCSDPVHVISIKSPFTAIYFYPCPFHLQVFPIKISVSHLSRPSDVPMRISHFDCSDPTLRS